MLLCHCLELKLIAQIHNFGRGRPPRPPNFFCRGQFRCYFAFCCCRWRTGRYCRRIQQHQRRILYHHGACLAKPTRHTLIGSWQCEERPVGLSMARHLRKKGRSRGHTSKRRTDTPARICAFVGVTAFVQVRRTCLTHLDASLAQSGAQTKTKDLTTATVNVARQQQDVR